MRSSQGAEDSTNEVTNVSSSVITSSGETKTAAGELDTASKDIAKKTVSLREEVEIFLSNIKAA